MHGFSILGILSTWYYFSNIGLAFSDISNSSDEVTHPSWKLLREENEDCGENADDKIFGGEKAAMGQYPWAALLGYKPSRLTKLFLCGGFLINRRYVMTAAHCLENTVTVVRLGDYDTRTDIDCTSLVCAAPHQDFAPEQLITHPEYNSSTNFHDIGLIRLDRNVDYNGWVSAVCLPKPGAKINKEGYAQVIGWGFVTQADYKANINSSNTITPVLRTVDVRLLSNENCTKQTHLKMVDFFFCAGGEGRPDTCVGDSGGALLQVQYEDDIPKYFAIGITSIGSKICGIGLPGIYVDVGYYMGWVLDQLKK